MPIKIEITVVSWARVTWSKLLTLTCYIQRQC
jgi:hypothetical protein